MITNIIPVIVATFFSVYSIDFLEPYSLLPPAPPIPKPSQPFGLINNTHHIKITPSTIRAETNAVFMI
jgi:hypothetical protein